MAEKISYEIDLSTQRAQAAVDKLAKKLQDAAKASGDNGAAAKVARANEDAVARVVRAQAAQANAAARFAAQREAEAARLAKLEARNAAAVAAARATANRQVAAAQSAVSAASSPAAQSQAQARLAAQQIASANQVAQAQQQATARVSSLQLAAAARYTAAITRQQAAAQLVTNAQLTGAQRVAAAQARAAAAAQQAARRPVAAPRQSLASQSGGGGGLSLGAIGNAAGAVASIESVRRALVGVFDATVKLQAVQGRLRFANNGDTKAAAQDFQFISATAERLGLKLADVGDGFSRFSAAARSSGLSADETKQIFLGVSESAKALGVSSFDTTLIFQALNQMTQKGVVSLEEFRGQMGERLPIAMKAATESTGLTEKEFIKLVESGQLLTKDFLPGFARELRVLSEGELPNATKTLESSANRLDTEIEKLQQRLGQGDLGKAMADGLNSVTKALQDGGTTEAIEAVAGGFAFLLKAAGDNIPKIGTFFSDLAKETARRLVLVINDLDMLGAKFVSTYGKIKAAAAGSIFTSWAFDYPEAAAADGQRMQGAEKEAEARGKERIAAYERRQKQLAQAQVKARQEAARLVAADQTTYTPEERRRRGLPASTNPPIPGKKPFVGGNGGGKKGDGDAKSKANALAAAQRSFETAQAEAQVRINDGVRDKNRARLEAQLALENISYATYLAERAKLEKDAIDGERSVREKQLAERELALAQAPDEPARLRAQGDIKRVEAELEGLKSKSVVLDVELDTDNKKLTEQARKYLEELDAAFAELQGDATGAAKARVAQSLQSALKDPNNSDARVQDALRRNAAAENVRIDYDGALDKYSTLADKLAGVEQGIQNDLNKGLISQLTAELRIDEARQKTKATMEEQLAVALKLAEATADPKAIEAVVALRRELDANTTSAQLFQKTLRDGLITDAKKGFADVLQGARSLREVLLEISINYLQKQADRYFDLGMASLEKGKGKSGAPAGYEEFGAQAGDSFISAIQGGWSTVQNLFSGLGDMLTKALSGLFSGGSGGGGFLSTLLGAASGAFGARLSGGGVDSGRGYIVGERGPEAFFPGASGTVVTSQRLEQTLAGMLKATMPAMPKMPNLSMPSFAGAGGAPGTTNVNVNPKVMVTTESILAGLRETSGFEGLLVELMVKNKRRFTG